MSWPRVPPNTFGIPFGLTGLGNVWLVIAQQGHAPKPVSTVLFVLAALAWLVVLGFYLAQGRAVPADLADNVAAPFVSLATIVPMVLAAQVLHPFAAGVGKIAIDVFLVLTVLIGGWLTGQWIYGPVDVDKVHPGYFLPTVAGGLLGSYCASVAGQRSLAWTMFGLGLVCWTVLGSIVLGRLLVRPALPAPLLPTLAIEVAPAAVASLAWFGLHGPHIDAVAQIFGGYGLLMVIAQVRLLPAYANLPFMPSTWAFTFSAAAVAGTGLVWLGDLRPAGYRIWEYVLLALTTVLVVWVAVRTVVALAQRRLLPR